MAEPEDYGFGVDDFEEEEDPLQDAKDDAQDTINELLREAIQHFEEELEQDLVDATDYYHGRPFGNEKEGRSQVVSTDVRDVTLGQMPSLMRIFFGSEKVVEYQPDHSSKVAMAKQATDAINYVIEQDNDGFLKFYSWFKDALVRRLGIVKWYWEEDFRVKSTQYTGLSEQQVAMLQQDPSVEVEIVEARPAGPPPPMQMGPGGIPTQPPQPLSIDVTVYRVEDHGVAAFDVIPNEEFFFTPESRSVDRAPMVAHVREVPADELIAMGIDEDLVREKQGELDHSLRNEGLEHARQINRVQALDQDTDALDKSQRPVPFAEAYAKMDLDGDDLAEVRMFQCIGNDFEIVNGDGLGEIVDEVPFAVITPDPEPHTIIGLSNYDLVGDVQKVKSHSWRAMLDSLTLSVNPQQEVVEGEVNIKDLLNPEIGSFIRVRRPGMVREVKHSFVGPDVLPVLAAQDEMRENRTGFTKNASGLDAEHLQSTTQVAAAAHVSASQQRIELIARVFAETGVKRLYKGLYKLLTQHQNRERMVRLTGGEWIPMDPRHWDAEMDVTVNVGLGHGTQQERLQLLSGIIGTQRELLEAGSPLVSQVELRNALGKAANLGGFKNDDLFFKPWGPQDEQAFQQQQAEAAKRQVDPNQMLMQLESSKMEMDAVEAQRKLALEEWKAQREDDRERDKLARETQLKLAEIKAKHNAEMEKADVQRDRNQQEVQERRRRATRPRQGE